MQVVGTIWAHEQNKMPLSCSVYTRSVTSVAFFNPAVRELMESIRRALAARQTRKRIRSAPGDLQDQNRQAAAVILEDAEKYGGPDAGLVRWAMAVVARKESELVVPEVRKNQSTLF
jgi:hypothetical protein